MFDHDDAAFLHMLVRSTRYQQQGAAMVDVLLFCRHQRGASSCHRTPVALAGCSLDTAIRCTVCFSLIVSRMLMAVCTHEPPSTLHTDQSGVCPPLQAAGPVWGPCAVTRGVECGSSLLILLICLAFSIISPLIVLFGCAFFAGTWVYWR
jgi:hypothetical protein